VTIFRRSIEVGNVVAAELAARQMRGLSLSDALDFRALVALRNRDRSRRIAARWLRRWLDEMAGVTIDEGVMVAGCLAALGGIARLREKRPPFIARSGKLTRCAPCSPCLQPSAGFTGP
jgi:hypothetical protein